MIVTVAGCDAVPRNERGSDLDERAGQGTADRFRYSFKKLNFTSSVQLGSSRQGKTYRDI